ncbi:hypothetical protein [Pseudarthrobacter sp. BIM B-2242]|uniref:hypothetical protein n=1 Tax=Pseudarthrobacter sp. BIM B-2242 TaxID=2772401 RepID=UPI00168B3947|nr:hypothetical protein [Pseudarthrobacter sp. BIM B-2242]QOD06042.1 hypothetical protein IDT60_20985 [Pseudarthrobacter sp. BIM B-2242]
MTIRPEGPHDTAIAALLNTFIDSDPRLDIWHRYPDISETEDDYTDGWACEQVSAEFAAFARKHGWDAVVVHADDPKHPLAFDHAWVRLTRDGSALDVDWTARQFHNLHDSDGNDPAVLTLPWPLAWDPAIVGRHSHPVAGPYDTITLEDR